MVLSGEATAAVKKNGMRHDERKANILVGIDG
jgi:hypothetical protein